jgi:hypothetical protein
MLIDRRWAYLGLGFTIENRTEGADKCPYLNEEALDPKWLEVIKSGALIVENQIG